MSCSSRPFQDCACCNKVNASYENSCYFVEHLLYLQLFRGYLKVRCRGFGNWPAWKPRGAYYSSGNFLPQLTAWWYTRGNRISNSSGIYALFWPSLCIGDMLGFQSSTFAPPIYRLTSLTLRIKIKLNEQIRAPRLLCTLSHLCFRKRIRVSLLRLFSVAWKKDWSVLYMFCRAEISPIFFLKLQIFLIFWPFPYYLYSKAFSCTIDTSFLNIANAFVALRSSSNHVVFACYKTLELITFFLLKAS